MSSVLSQDPLTVHLTKLATLTTAIERNEPGYGSVSQQAHVATWNCSDGIRAEAFAAGLLTDEENALLKQALELWPWLSDRDRHATNCVVTILFYVRKHFGWDCFDRAILATVTHFRIKPEKPSVPSAQWRKSRQHRLRDRERSSFVGI